VNVEGLNLPTEQQSSLPRFVLVPQGPDAGTAVRLMLTICPPEHLGVHQFKFGITLPSAQETAALPLTFVGAEHPPFASRKICGPELVFLASDVVASGHTPGMHHCHKLVLFITFSSLHQNIPGESLSVQSASFW
jgi:hypothetical protein